MGKEYISLCLSTNTCSSTLPPFLPDIHIHTHPHTVALGYTSQLWQSSPLLFLLLVSLSGSAACASIAGVGACICVCGSARRCVKDGTSSTRVSLLLLHLSVPPSLYLSVLLSLSCSSAVLVMLVSPTSTPLCSHSLYSSLSVSVCVVRLRPDSALAIPASIVRLLRSYSAAHSLSSGFASLVCPDSLFPLGSRPIGRLPSNHYLHSSTPLSSLLPSL